MDVLLDSQLPMNTHHIRQKTVYGGTMSSGQGIMHSALFPEAEGLARALERFF